MTIDVLRAVLDTNISLRGTFRPSFSSGRILDAFRNGRFTLVTSEPLLAELADVLARPKVQRKYSLQSRHSALLLALLRERGEIVEVTGTLHLCRDPKDDMVIETAMNGRAEFIVSEDKDLLSMTIAGIRVVTAIEFLRILEA